MSTIFSKWFSPIVAETPSTNFRAKLSADHTDDDAVELAGFSTPAETELKSITGKPFESIVHTELHSSAQVAPSDHPSVKWSSTTAQHPLPDGHSNLNRSSQANTASTGPHGPADQLTQDHWQQTTSDIRLLLSVLLEQAAGPQSASQQASLQLQQLLSSNSWEEACQHCRDGMLLCTLLLRYFAVDMTNSNPSIDSRPCNSADSCNSSYPDSDDSTHSLPNQLHRQRQTAAGQYFVDPLQDLLEQPASRDQSYARKQVQPGLLAADISILQHLQEQVWLLRVQDCWQAAAAAGWLLPQNCSPGCVATADSEGVLQLFSAVIVAGESRQCLQQSSCLEALQQLQQLQRQQRASSPSRMYTQLQASASAVSCSSQGDKRHGGDCSSPSIGSRHLLEAEPEQSQQDQLQQHKQQFELSKAGIWPLVRAWLRFMAELPQQLLHSEQPQQQLGLAGDSRGSMTWAGLLATFSQLQHQHSNQAGGVALEAATKAQQPPSDAVGPSEDSSKANSSSTGTNLASAQPLQQQLGRWGCTLPLLQEGDLVNLALQGDDCPDAMQLVVLLRLLDRTSSIWVPAAAAAEAARHAAAGQTQQQQDEAHNDGVESPRTPKAGQSPVSDATDDVTTSPKNCWPPELLTQPQLWPGDSDETDSVVMSREERTLRCWINSLLRQSERGAGRSANARTHSQTAPRRQCSNVTSASVVLNPRASSDLNSLDVQEFAATSSDDPSAAASITAAPPALQPTATADWTLHKSASSKDTRAATKPPPVAVSARDSLTGDMLPGSNGGGSPTAACNFSFRSISSLYGAEVRSGVLLLELLEHLQPGCVDWKVANKLPFKGVGISPQLQALENCQLVLRVAQDELGLPLVSMSPRDVVLGRRKIILSLVYQLMRYHTMQLLEGIAAAQQQQQSVSPVSSGSQQQFTAALAPQASVGRSSQEGSISSSPTESPSQTPRAAHLVKICSSSKKQRKGRQLGVSEEDILAWANRRLQQVQPLHVQIPDGSSCSGSSQSEMGSGHIQQQGVVPRIRSFKDPALSSGVVLLQLLHAMDPAAVDLSYVAPGATAEQRESNAKYALNVADRMGCSLFLIWEDLVDLQLNMVLVLLASLMYLDLRQGVRSSTSS